MNIDLSYLNNGRRVSFPAELTPTGKLAIEPKWAELPELKDMVVSDHVLTTYSQAITLGVQLGLEAVPLLGDSIYDSKSNPKYPEIIPGDQFQGGACVFAEVKEGEEIPLGHVWTKTMDNLQLKGYGAAFQFSKKARLFDTTGDFAERWSKALGEAWNHLRNSLRLYPIIAATLEGASATGIQYKTSTYDVGASGAGNYHYEATIYATLAAGIKAAKVAKRPVSVILCASADEDAIREAVNVGYRGGNVVKDALKLQGIKEVVHMTERPS